MYLPVFVPGAKLSVGDLHFSEADGEPTAAIEMSGKLALCRRRWVSNLERHFDYEGLCD